MGRRRSLVARFLGLSLALAACGGDPVTSAPDGGGPGFDVTNVDDSGHLHSFHIACEDLEADAVRSYVTDGLEHSHTVFLAPAELAEVAAGQAVSISFTEGHRHTFVVELPDGSC